MTSSKRLHLQISFFLFYSSTPRRHRKADFIRYVNSSFISLMYLFSSFGFLPTISYQEPYFFDSIKCQLYSLLMICRGVVIARYCSDQIEDAKFKATYRYYWESQNIVISGVVIARFYCSTSHLLHTYIYLGLQEERDEIITHFVIETCSSGGVNYWKRSIHVQWLLHAMYQVMWPMRHINHIILYGYPISNLGDSWHHLLCCNYLTVIATE